MRWTALISAVLACGALSAQEGTLWLTAQGGLASHDRDFKNGTALGGAAGTWFTNRFGAELGAYRLQPEPLAGGQKLNEYHGVASLLFGFRSQPRTWIPYLRVGGGVARILGHNRPEGHLGLGLQGHLSPHVVTTFEVRGTRVSRQVVSYTETLALLGLGWRFAPPKPAPAPPPPPAEAEPEVLAPAPTPEPPPPVEEPKAQAPAEPQVETARTAPPPPPRKIVLDDAKVHFANGKADLIPEAFEEIRKVAEMLKPHAGTVTLIVSGHTSSVGSPAFNRTLGKARAAAVAKALEECGLPARIITAVGMGPDRPIADNKSTEGQARNRRVEIDVIPKGEHVEVRKSGRGSGLVLPKAVPARPRVRKAAPSAEKPAAPPVDPAVPKRKKIRGS